MVCTSVMRPMTPDEFASVLRDLRAAAPRGVEVVIGGGGIPDHFEAPPDRVRVVGELREMLAAA